MAKMHVGLTSTATVKAACRAVAMFVSRASLRVKREVGECD